MKISQFIAFSVFPPIQKRQKLFLATCFLMMRRMTMLMSMIDLSLTYLGNAEVTVGYGEAERSPPGAGGMPR